MSFVHPRAYSPTIRIEGPLNAGELTLDDLLALPSETHHVQYLAANKPMERTFRGVRLWTLLHSRNPKMPPGLAGLRYVIVVESADGLATTFSWGELDPEHTAAPALIAYEEDGQLLGEGGGIARVAVPGHQTGGRFITAVASIRLLDPTA